MAKVKILLVEDEKIVALDIQNTLNRLGYSVPACAVSGEEAIKQAEKTQPDLVLMDIVLTGKIDGIQAAEQIRRRFGIPVVYLTAYADGKTLKRAKITEPFGYILKPFQEKELYTSIEIALYKHSMESKLKENEEKYRELVENINDVIYATDENGLITYISPVIESVTGFSQAEIIGHPYTHFIHKEDIPRITKQFKKDASGSLEPSEYRILTKSGEQRWIRTFSRPLVKENRFLGLRGVMTDITERKQADEKLHYQADMLQNVSDAIISTDLDFDIRTWNRVAETMYGWEAYEVFNKRLDKLTQTEYLNDCKEEVLKKLFKEGSWRGEVIQRRKDNTTINVLLSVSLIKESSGNSVGIVAVSRDITKLKQALENSIQSEEKYRTIIELAPDGIVTVDLKGVITSCNPASTKISGYPIDTVVGKHFSKMPILCRRDIPKYTKIFTSLLRGKIPKLLECKWVHEDGSLRTAEVRVSIVQKSNKITGFQAIARDITERKYAEDEIKRRLEIEKSLAALSKNLVKAKQITVSVNNALATIGKIFDVDRVYLLQVREEANILDSTHEWFRKGLKSQKEKLQGMSSDAFSPWIRKLRRDQIISIFNTEKLPAGFIKKIRIRSIKSFLVVHLYTDKKLFGALALFNTQKTRGWRADDISILRAAGEIITSALVKDRYQHELTQALKELEIERKNVVELAKRTIDAQEKERLYLASEIHDDMLQNLVAILYFLQMFDISSFSKEMQERKENLLEIIKGTIDRGRTLISEIEPIREPEIGLIEAIKNSIKLRFAQKDIFAEKDTNIKFTYPEKIPKISFVIKINILRIIQEASMNVRKHAQATELTVKISASKNRLEIEIKDNGIGFQPELVSKKVTGHYGLLTMRERARLVGGELAVKSKPGQGTTIKGVFPLKGSAS